MISENELRRLAAAAGVDAMVHDLDYGLGWFLAGLFSQTSASDYVIFKGGTCLRKCYYADYRFSEDLDFTLARNWTQADIRSAIETVLAWSIEADGPDFGAAPLRIDILNDEYGKESLQARIYYRGPLRWGGPPRVLQLDMSREETMVFPVCMQRLHHAYSDAGRLPQVVIPCYSTAEMLAEKIRAISGQRRFAISRDIFDVHRLVGAGVSFDDVRRALPIKLAAKGLSLDSLSVARLQERRAVFAGDWQRRLTHLLPPGRDVTFEQAWQEVIGLVEQLQGAG